MPLLDAASEGTDEEAARARVVAHGTSIDGRLVLIRAAAGKNAVL